ncbi:polysaccharide deacetylase family protein [Demequina lignilytica]|uniref:Polysaccharide deacetylase family protein n=1 Tax=Demequina lignilytica TaxID=3051663 RepID=A0AB35MIX3_9MICO|nr:polysaccharide deacetylase family protein [Demequina sp. SYSU T0a273]MDN4483660.1 polysaccharide deacetylase family protein [Demequina sp. SYSU T0a273]
MRTRGITIGAVAGALILTSCSGSATEPTASPTHDPTASLTATEQFVAPALLTVDPSTVDGIDVEVDESLAKGHYTYVAIPLLPNGEDIAEIMRAHIEPRLQAFRDFEAIASDGVEPELTVSWDLVGASPDAVGVRLASAEVGGEVFDGSSTTVWIDVAAREERTVLDLFDPDTYQEVLDRIVAAGSSDPRIDTQMFNDQMDGEWEAFDSVAFTPEGELWVEFDRAQVATSTAPVGVEISAEGVLSEFGLVAQASALSPSDPLLEAVVAPQPSETGTSTGAPPLTQTTTGDTDCAVEKCIALTFDDGPVAGTNELLDILADRGAKATFFMVGKNATANPDVVARVAAEGHVIGTHTWDHPQLTRLGADEVRSEIEKASDAIEAASGVRPTLLRPPYGATNDTVAGVAAELGLAQILWDVDPEDWKDKDSAIVRDRVVSHAHRNAIILSHDIHPTTRGAYAEIIDALLADGYTLVTVPDLIDDLEPGRKYFNGS